MNLGTASASRVGPSSRIYPAKSEPDIAAIASSSDSSRRGPGGPPATPRAQTQRGGQLAAPMTQPVNRTRKPRSPPPVKPVSYCVCYLSAECYVKLLSLALIFCNQWSSYVTLVSTLTVSKLNMQTRVAKVTQTCFFQLRRLLGRDITANIVALLVLTCLGYNNALLAGLPYSTIARLVYGLRPKDHINDATIKLHRLPIHA